jgi:hypothetical protein
MEEADILGLYQMILTRDEDWNLREQVDNDIKALACWGRRSWDSNAAVGSLLTFNLWSNHNIIFMCINYKILVNCLSLMWFLILIYYSLLMFV